MQTKLPPPPPGYKWATEQPPDTLWHDLFGRGNRLKTLLGLGMVATVAAVFVGLLRVI